MSNYQINAQINAIATRALLDPGFKDAILNGQRRQKLQEFDLSEELVNAIMQIKGDDIHQFINKLNDLMLSSRKDSNPADMSKKSYQTPHLNVIDPTASIDAEVLEAVQRLQRIAWAAQKQRDLSRRRALQRLASSLTRQP
jgi:hypothetical protein